MTVKPDASVLYIRLPRWAHDALKQAATENGKSLTKFCRDLLLAASREQAVSDAVEEPGEKEDPNRVPRIG